MVVRKLGNSKKIIHHAFTPLILIAIFIGIMGIMPHIMFSMKMGEISYFKSAYDEDYYINQAINGNSGHYRLLSAFLINLLYFIVGNNLESTLIFADFIFPFFCGIAAGLIAHLLAHNTLTKILIVIFLLFGQELLSLGSSAIWQEQTQTTTWSLAFWRSQWSPWGEMVIPDYSTSYFSLFRSPEPQISWIVLFGYIAFLVRFLTKHQGIIERWYFAIVFFLLNTLLIFSYIFISLPLIIFLFISASILWLWCYQKNAFYLIASCAYITFINLLIYLGFKSSTGSTSLIFNSRLPIITPAVLLSFIALTLIISLRRNLKIDKMRLSLSVTSLSIPIILTNQQLLTGIMVSTKEWERYANYPFLILGISIVFCSQNWRKYKKTKLITTTTALFFIAYFAHLLFIGQESVYHQWYAKNELVFAQKRAVVEAIDAPQLNHAKIIIEEPGTEPLLAIKLNKPVHFITDYRELFSFPISDMPSNGGLPANQSKYRENLFECFARTAKTPSDVSEILKNEAIQKSGWYLGFLFSFKDFWYPATDGRLVRQNEILKNIDAIVSAYTEYLKTPKIRWFDTAIMLSKKAPEELEINPIWRNRLLSEGVAGQTKVYAYEQEVKPTRQLHQRSGS